MNDATEKIMRKKEKRMKRKAEQEFAETEGKADQELAETLTLPDDQNIFLPSYDFADDGENVAFVETFPKTSPE